MNHREQEFFVVSCGKGLEKAAHGQIYLVREDAERAAEEIRQRYGEAGKTWRVCRYLGREE